MPNPTIEESLERADVLDLFKEVAKEMDVSIAELLVRYLVSVASGPPMTALERDLWSIRFEDEPTLADWAKTYDPDSKLRSYDRRKRFLNE